MCLSSLMKEKREGRGCNALIFFSIMIGSYYVQYLILNSLLLEVCVFRNVGVISILTKLRKIDACTCKSELFYFTDLFCPISTFCEFN